MSGGSWNYLYTRDTDRFASDEYLPYIYEAANLAEALSYPIVAQDLRDIGTEISDFIKRLDYRLDNVRPVLKALEWFDCGDYSEDETRKALEKRKREIYENIENR